MSVLKKWKVAFAAFAVLLAVLFGAAFSAVSASAEELDQLKTNSVRGAPAGSSIRLPPFLPKGFR